MEFETNGKEVEELKEILWKYKDVFATGETTLTQLKDVEHVIELTNYTPIRRRAYNTDIKSQEIIDETVDELL